MTLKAVAFDLWETLITNPAHVGADQKALRLERIEEILTARGHGAAAHRIDDAHGATWHRCQELYWSRDEDVPCRRQIEHFLEAMELDAREFSEEALAEIEHAYAMTAVDIPPALVDGAAETVSQLKTRGLGIGLISNTGRTPGYALREVLAALGLASSIDVMVFSNEHGFCKPQTSIFEELRRGLNVAYEEMVFVGDNPYADVHGAQRVGMKAVLFTPPVKGEAVAAHVEHGLDIVPDATITRLSELLRVLEQLS